MKCKLGTLAAVKGGKRLPKGINLISTPNSPPYIRVRDLNDQRTLEINSNYEFVDDETQKQIARYIVQKGDIILSIVGTIGLAAMVGESLDNANLTENCVKIVVSEKIDNKFLYYYLKSPLGQAEIARGTVGAVQAKLPIKNIQDIDVWLPRKDIQTKIASLLSCLDDKIELNNKVNENLERQAQAIYQEWFGDVDAAKERRTLSDICSYSKDRVVVSDLDICMYFSTENMLPEKAGATEASSLPTAEQTTACHAGDTLVSNIRPYFKKIVYCHEACGCSADVLCFVPVHSKYSAYLYSTLYADRFFDFMVAGSKGTKMPRGDKQQILTYPVTLPTDEELDRFNLVAVPILEQIQNNRNENKALSTLRDTLLPELMSEEIMK